MTESTPQPSQSPIPGWYPEPQGNMLRWWDGSRWTEHVRVPDTAPAGATAPIEPEMPYVPAFPNPPPAPEVGERRYWPWVAVMVALVVLIVGGLTLLSGAEDDETAPSDIVPSGEVTDAQSAARTAQTAMETFATDNGGSYAGVTPAELVAIEPTLSGAALSVAGQTTGYTISVSAGTSSFTITRTDGGVTTFTCTPPGGSGCDQTGTWGLAG